MNYHILALLDHCYSTDLVLKDTVHVVSFGSSCPFFFFFFFLLFSVVIACIVKLPCNRL